MTNVPSRSKGADAIKLAADAAKLASELSELSSLAHSARVLDMSRALALPIVAAAAVASAGLGYPWLVGAVTLLAALVIGITRTYLSRRSERAYMLLMEMHKRHALQELEYRKLAMSLSLALEGRAPSLRDEVSVPETNRPESDESNSPSVG